MAVESTGGRNFYRFNALASEVARHQQVKKSLTLGFNSRRLHQKKYARLCRAIFFGGAALVLYASHDFVVT